MKTVLFVCSGNYYRSRFAEEWFNHLAASQGLPWRAASRGLLDLEGMRGNPGPMSVHAIAYLRELGVEPAGLERMPEPIADDAPGRFERIICVNGPEHRPMVEARSALRDAEIEYWDIRDLDKEPTLSALVRCKERVEALLNELQPQDDHTP